MYTLKVTYSDRKLYIPKALDQNPPAPRSQGLKPPRSASAQSSACASTRGLKMLRV